MYGDNITKSLNNIFGILKSIQLQLLFETVENMDRNHYYIGTAIVYQYTPIHNDT